MKTILLTFLTVVLMSSTSSKITNVSWYGPGFHGKMTANGETYNQDDITAASPVLPFNTLVRVTNLDNGKSIVVRINDRGPYKCIKGTSTAVRPLEPHPKRGFDLSKGAFSKIANIDKGVLNIKYQIIK